MHHPVGYQSIPFIVFPSRYPVRYRSLHAHLYSKTPAFLLICLFFAHIWLSV